MHARTEVCAGAVLDKLNSRFSRGIHLGKQGVAGELRDLIVEFVGERIQLVTYRIAEIVVFND